MTVNDITELDAFRKAQAAEAQNFAWAAWVYRGQGFGLAAEPGTDLEANIADALALNSSAARKAALSTSGQLRRAP